MQSKIGCEIHKIKLINYITFNLPIYFSDTISFMDFHQIRLKYWVRKSYILLTHKCAPSVIAPEQSQIGPYLLRIPFQMVINLWLMNFSQV